MTTPEGATPAGNSLPRGFRLFARRRQRVNRLRARSSGRSGARRPRDLPPARPPRLKLSKAPFWHRAAEWLLHALAISAIVAIVLILVFIAKEAAPILYSKVVRDEVTLAKMWIPQLWPGYDEAGRSGSRCRTSRSSASGRSSSAR